MLKKKALQKTLQNNSKALIRLDRGMPDTLEIWIQAYFRFEVTTSVSSQKEQGRDLSRFRDFMIEECRSDERPLWSPRLSSAYKRLLKDKGYKDRTVNRAVAHLKTFAKWIHKLRPFPLGNPMAKLKLMPVGSGLEVERAITSAERRRILDAADLLPMSGGRSKDRHRYRGQERPRRKNYRPYRNRAIVYTLIETGMRRAAVSKINLSDVDFKKRLISVEEKGGLTHGYKITREGLAAIRDYVEEERELDFRKWKSPALFLAPASASRGRGRLHPVRINEVWNRICKKAGVKGKTPHSARHAMGKHIIEKTGNVAAVQRQLGHKNAAYSMQYARITDEELGEVLEDR